MNKSTMRLAEAAALFVFLPATTGTRIVSSYFFAHVKRNIIQIVIRNKSDLFLSRHFLDFCDLVIIHTFISN